MTAWLHNLGRPSRFSWSPAPPSHLQRTSLSRVRKPRPHRHTNRIVIVCRTHTTMVCRKKHNDGAHITRLCSFKSDAFWRARNSRIYLALVSDSGRRARGTSTIWRIRQERSYQRSAASASATSSNIHVRSHVDTTLKILLNTLRALSLCMLCVESTFSESTLVFP